VVYAKAAFGRPAAVVRYLARYTHRVAIRNHRSISDEGALAEALPINANDSQDGTASNS
jgi:hypothetical protein